jgi:hypothetical protein
MNVQSNLSQAFWNKLNVTELFLPTMIPFVHRTVDFKEEQTPTFLDILGRGVFFTNF